MTGGPSESGSHFIGDYKKCQKFFYWRYIKGLKPRYTPKPLLFGRAVHEGLAAWYTNLLAGNVAGERTKAAIEVFEETMQQDKDEWQYTQEWHESYINGKHMLAQYGIHYAFEKWKPWLVEKELKYIYPSGNQITGRIDLGIRNEQGLLYIVDHKTTGWPLAKTIKNLSTNDQATCYLLLAATVADKPVIGVIYNIIKSYKGKIEFARSVVSKTKQDILDYKREADAVLSEITDKVEIMPASCWFKDTSACYRYNRACDYLDLCKGSNYQGLIGTQFKEENNR